MGKQKTTFELAIFRGIVAWPKADGPKEQVGNKRNNKCPEEPVSKFRKKKKRVYR
jgi:hypothetical protein